jgi:hypothetical protein
MYITDKENTKFKVCNRIRKFLLENKTIQMLVGNRIFPIISIEQAGQGDFIVYQRESYSQMKTKQGIYDQQCTVFITCVSSDYDTSQEIAEQVYLTLQNVYNYIDQDNGIIINQIDLEDSTEDYAADRYLQVLKFRIQ